MLSSIILLLLAHYEIVRPDISLGFWKWYIVSVVIESFVYSRVLPKVLDWFDKVRK